MKNKKSDYEKESVAQKYNRIRKAFERICKDNNLSCEEHLKKYPVDAGEKLSDYKLSQLIDLLNKDLRLLIKGLYIEDWTSTIYASFDEYHQEGVLEMLDTTLKGDPAETFTHFSKTNELLKLLNNDATKETALIFLENYCATNSFENIVNNYDLVFRSKHLVDANEARKRGFARQSTFCKRNKDGYRAYFNPSDKKHQESEAPSEPCNG